MSLYVQRIRQGRGWSREEAARRARVPSQVLYRVETGRQLPWPALRERLAQLYGVEPGVLFRDIDAAQEFLRQKAGEIHGPEAA